MTFMRVCMDCRPGLRSVAGVALSHGYCRFHGLQLLEREHLITRPECLELWVRRHAIGLFLVVAGAVLLALSFDLFRAQLPRSFGARSFWDAVAPLERVTGPRSNAGFLRTGSTGKALAGGVPPFLGQDPKGLSLGKFHQHPQRVRVASTHGLADVQGPRCTISTI
jgi:hypothetical protein